jgi:hypothetical protein
MFMSSLNVKGHIKSWEAHERDQKFGENKSTDIVKSQKQCEEGNDRIIKVLAMQPGLATIIDNILISRHFEGPETDHHIAKNVCCINYTGPWSSKRVR